MRERDSSRMKERERGKEREDGRVDTVGISRQEHTSAEQPYVLCSFAADVCDCLLTGVLFCLHRAKGKSPPNKSFTVCSRPATEH